MLGPALHAESPGVTAVVAAQRDFTHVTRGHGDVAGDEAYSGVRTSLGEMVRTILPYSNPGQDATTR